MPARIKLDQFDGLDWATWSGILEAILMLHEAEDLLRFIDVPTNITEEQWGSLQRRTKAYLRLYVKPDVYSLIASNTDLPTFKDKWDKLGTPMAVPLAAQLFSICGDNSYKRD